MKSVAKNRSESSKKADMGSAKLSLIALIGAASIMRCGSLIGETDRIRMLYAQQNAATVTATDPADNSIAPYNQSYIDVTFSHTIDAGTVTAQTTFGACTGSLQVSYDGFINCLPGTIDASGNPRIRFTPTIFPKGLGLQLRISNAVISSLEVAATPYTSPNGFKLGAPCGGQNCFFSYSTPLMFTAGTRSGIFLIRGGPLAGKYLVYTTGLAVTTVIDPVAVTSSDGPSMTASGSPCTVPGGSAHNFLNNAGTKEIIVRGDSTTGDFCVFDHATNTFSAGAGFPSMTGLGGLAIQPKNGGQSGNTLILAGNNSTGIHKYDSSDAPSGSPYSLLSGANIGAHSLRVVTTTGPYQNKFLIFLNAAITNVFDETTPGITGGYTLPLDVSNGVGNGSSSFQVFTGARQGQVLTIRGENRTSVFAYDVVAGAVAGSQPTLPSGVGAGGLLLRQPNTATDDSPLVIHGAGYLTSKYDSASGTFSSASSPLTTGLINTGAASIFIPSATNGGAFLVVNGNGMPSTSVYFPATNSFSATRTPTNIPNQGSNSFVINGGPRNGKTFIVSGTLSSETAIFDPLRFDITRGPTLSANASINSFNLTLPTINQVVIFHGNATTYNVYDPGTDTVSATGGPTLAWATGAGAVAFTLPGTSKFVVMRGAGTSNGEMFDAANLAAAATSAPASCSLAGPAFSLRYNNSAAGQPRQLVFCSGTSMARFNHAGGAFLTSLTLTGAGAGAGMQGFIISGGSESGKILIIHGGGAATSTLIDPSTDPETVSAGPSVTPACATAPGNGAQIMQLFSGSNAGKVLLVAGNTSADTCFYDPSTNQFIASGSGNKVGSGVGFQIGLGSLAFRTNGGLYPTSFVILSGANKNVWSTYVP